MPSTLHGLFIQTGTIARGGSGPCFADEETESEKRLHLWAELNTQAVSCSRQRSGPDKGDTRWLLRLCHLLTEPGLLYNSTYLRMSCQKPAIGLTFLSSSLFPFKVCFVSKRRLPCVFFILTFLYEYIFCL